MIFRGRLRGRPLSCRLSTLSVGDSVALLDLSRAARAGFPEIIFGEGKSAEQIAQIMLAMYRNSHAPIIASRVSAEQHAYVQKALSPHLQAPHTLQYHDDARILHIQSPPAASPLPSPARKVSVLSAGTSDYRVASEAAILLQLTLPPSVRVQVINDVGVAGLHRLITHLPTIQDADVIIVVAGMDGALPSVVGGLVPCPVIAVPTSVGYGAAFGGVSALLTMLNSCSPGVTVVNIDNGFGAAVSAHKIIAGLAKHK